MDKGIDKQSIVNEYLLGLGSYRELAKKHGVGRTAINRCAGIQGRWGAESMPRKAFPLPQMKEENKAGILPGILLLQQQLEQVK